jgi:glycosyltransferase involved in cell wall biosynthesis
MPLAVTSLRIPRCDLVVSLSHCVAKSARVPEGVPHICYCFTPMRYAWHQRQAYFNGDRTGSWKARLIDRLLEGLRQWDRKTAAQVTSFVAISRTVQERIRDCYGRESEVIYPPVDTDFYSPGTRSRDDYYLVVSAFAPYKRLDLAITACNLLRRQLIVIGTGQDERRLRRIAGPNTHFLGWQSDEVIRDYLRRAQALLFPGEEDFGIVPVEAMACGTPVIAFARGGATETIVPLEAASSADSVAPSPTGIWFTEQTNESLVAAVQSFERRVREFHSRAIRQQALRFSRRRFEEEFFAYVGHTFGLPGVPSRKAA